MSLVVLNRPLLDYIAVKNPCLYKFRRRDFELTSITAGSPNVTVVISGDVTASILVGHTVIIFTTDLTKQRTGVVTSSTFAAGNTTVIFLNSGANIGSIGTGYLNNLSRFNYRAEIEVYTSPSNTLIGTLSYSPDKSGLIKADVSEIVKSVMSPDITTTSIVPSAWFTDNALCIFYIKYREVWTGSSNSQTDDVANLRNAVYAANQIGDANNQLAYPSILGRIYAVWEGLNFFTYVNNNTANIYLRLTKDRVSFYVPIPFLTGIQSIAYEAFKNPAIGQSITAAIDWTGLSLTKHTVTLGIAQNSESLIYLVRSFDQAFDFVYTIETNNVGTFTLEFNVYSEANILVSTLTAPINAFNGTQTGSVNINVAGNTVKRVDVRVISVAVSAQAIVLSTSINLIGDLSSLIIATTLGSTDTILSFLPNVKNIKTCANPFNVVWRNRYGGLSNYVFQYNQTFTWRFRDQYKAKEFVLYADQLTDDQIEQLEDLNQVGDLYSVAYDELPTNVIQKRIGTQVYKCDTDGKLTGITVTPTGNSYKTLFSRSRAKITVELPETIY